MKVDIYTDGSAYPNPGEGGWAIVTIVNDEETYIEYGYEESATNNTMELTAFINALKSLHKEQVATIYSDSQYVVNGYNFWMMNWERKNWTKSNGKIKNLDYWKELFELRKTRPLVNAEWVRGHDGDRFNEMADNWACIGREEQTNGKDETIL